MARAAKVQPKGPDWPPAQTLRMLKQQLEKLQEFKGKNHREVENEETVWQQTTEGAMIHGFGEGNHNVGHFHKQTTRKHVIIQSYATLHWEQYDIYWFTVNDQGFGGWAVRLGLPADSRMYLRR